MIYEDLAVAAVIALFVWIVPVRPNGIPGLRGRGKLPSPPLSSPLSPPLSFPLSSPPERGRRYPVPPDHAISQAAATSPEPGLDGRILAELDTTWEPGYADQVAALLRPDAD